MTRADDLEPLEEGFTLPPEPRVDELLLEIEPDDEEPDELPDELQREAQAELAAALAELDTDEPDDTPELQAAAEADRGERTEETE